MLPDPKTYFSHQTNIYLDDGDDLVFHIDDLRGILDQIYAIAEGWADVVVPIALITETIETTP